MTEEQIKAYLDGRRMTKKALRDNGQAFFVDTYEDADRIIDALEKQIPKKPKENCNNDCYIWKSLCPNCGSELDDDYKPRFCDYCGQHIDWSEEE